MRDPVQERRDRMLQNVWVLIMLAAVVLSLLSAAFGWPWP